MTDHVYLVHIILQVALSMDALKSYSGEESSSENEANEKDLNESANGQDKEVHAGRGNQCERSKVMFKY